MKIGVTASMVLTVCTAGLLSACEPSETSTPTVPPGPTVSAAPGEALITVTYYGRPETPATRGPCPRGYTQGNPPMASQGAPFSCAYDSYNSDPLKAEVGTAYQFDLGSLHCGLSFVQFDGHVYVPDGLGPASHVSAPGRYGTMTLTSANHATFQGLSGGTVPLHAVSSVRLSGCL